MSNSDYNPLREARDPNAPAPRIRLGVWVAIAIFSLWILWMTFFYKPTPDPERDARYREAAVIEECRKQMDDRLLSASTREAARFMCNGLRNDYVRKYGREP